MIVKKSDLNIENLFILACNIATIPVNSEIKSPILDNIDLEIDFNILNNAIDKSEFKIVLSITANNENVKKPGYFFSLVTEGIFSINGFDQQPKEQIDSFLKFGALPMLINHVRSYLMNTTSFYPYGKYTLPAIDLSELLKNKQEQAQKKVPVKK